MIPAALRISLISWHITVCCRDLGSGYLLKPPGWVLIEFSKKNPLEMLWVRPTQRSWSWKSHALYSSQWCVLLWKREIALQVVFSCFRKEHPRNKNRIQIQMDKYHKKYQRPPRLHSLCRCLDLASPRDPECCYISGKKDDAKKGEAMEGGNAYSGHLVNLGSSIPNDVVWKDEPYLGQWT